MLDSSKENAEKAKQWALEYIMSACIAFEGVLGGH